MGHAGGHLTAILLSGLSVAAAAHALAQAQQPETKSDQTAPATAAQRECDRLAAPAVPFAHQGLPAPAPDWQQAIAACTQAAREAPGEPRFEFELGHAYEKTKSYVEAAQHYRIAVDAGSSEGQRALGTAYYLGLGVVKNKQTAYELWSRAAAAGNPYAMANLGAMFGNGDFVARDDAKALDWFDKAIAAGDAGALGQVGVAFFYGRGSPVDYKMAAQYFQQAADLGDGYSLKFLAVMYERGLLGPADHAKAAALRQRAQLVDPDSATPDVPLPRTVPRGQAGQAGRALGGGDSNATNQFYTGSVAVNRWHGIATHLPRCWPICSLR